MALFRQMTCNSRHPMGLRHPVLDLDNGGSTYQHTATHCNALQRTATHCNTLQHTFVLCLENWATFCLIFSFLSRALNRTWCHYSRRAALAHIRIHKHTHTHTHTHAHTHTHIHKHTWTNTHTHTHTHTQTRFVLSRKTHWSWYQF